MRLGVIADDFTGAVDIAGFLAKEGLKTFLCFDVGRPIGDLQGAAVVVCLKIRSCPVDEAVSLALSALTLLRNAGCTVYYYKYCSTFDCTPQGNIGQVCDALRQALACPTTLVCPALPVNGRTVYNGYLFVKDLLLSESPMRFHPVNPMWESRIERILSTQTSGVCRNLPLSVVRAGPSAVEEFIAGALSDGVAYVIPDVIEDADLDVLAQACESLPLLTGGSGLGGALARRYPSSVPSSDDGAAPVSLPRKLPDGVILSGSCSVATNMQVRTYLPKAQSVAVDVFRLMDDLGTYVTEIADWVCRHQTQGAYPLVYSTCDAEARGIVTDIHGKASVAEAVEKFFALLAVALDMRGVGTFIIAGGETSSAVVQALRLSPSTVLDEINPGVSWIMDAEERHYLALKSGNFGNEDFFIHAQEVLALVWQGVVV